MKANKTKILVSAVMMAGMVVSGFARDAKGIKIYINPGHGGHEANDRNVVIAPYTSGDPNGYWESNSNLSKGLQLRDMLLAKGYSVEMSRVTNTEDDDLALSTIVSLSNKSGCDVFFSIHSNATGTSARRNFPLMLYRGYDNDPVIPSSLVVCKILNKYLLQNQATYWTSTSENCRGDWSFYKDWGTSGLGALRGQNMTSMLSEGSFHDYIPEAYRLMSDDFCWVEAWHFRKTIDEYFGVDGVDYGVVAGRLNDSRVPRSGDYVMFGDDKLATIQGATVELVDADNNVIDTYTTDPIHINGFYLFKNVKPGTYTVRVKVETHMPEETTVNVVADEITFANFKMSKVRNTPPVVESYSPVWNENEEGVLCNSPIVLHFNWDMDTEATEKAFSINPPVEGTFSWSDLNYCMTFTPNEPYNISTKYTVTLSTEAMHPAGLHLEEPFSFSFLTSDRNFMDVLGYFPKQDEEVHYSGATVEFRFDKIPYVVPVLSYLSCKDSSGNAVKFNNRGLKSSPAGAEYGWFRIPFSSNLTIGETYTLELSGQFSDKDGITIQKPISVQFKAVDAGAEKPEMKIVNELNTHTAFTYNQEGSENVTTASVSKSTDKLFGASAVTFDYTFNDNTSGEALYSYSLPEGQDAVSVEPSTTLGIHVYGDLTNNELALELTNENTVQYIHVCNMDFLGWRYISLPVQLEGVARLTGVKVIQNPSMISKSGSFKLDNIIASATNAVDDVLSDIDGFSLSVGSEYIVANAGCYIQGIELVGINGQIIVRNQGNIINVSEVPAGNYIVVVHAGGVQKVEKVQIVH